MTPSELKQRLIEISKTTTAITTEIPPSPTNSYKKKIKDKRPKYSISKELFSKRSKRSERLESLEYLERSERSERRSILDEDLERKAQEYLRNTQNLAQSLDLPQVVNKSEIPMTRSYESRSGFNFSRFFSMISSVFSSPFGTQPTPTVYERRYFLFIFIFNIFIYLYVDFALNLHSTKKVMITKSSIYFILCH